MKAKGFDQKTLAARLGVKPATVSRYLSGQRLPSGLHMPALQELLDISRGAIVSAAGQAERAPVIPVDAAVDEYPNRAAFLRLHGDQISQATAEYVRGYARREGDMSLVEWRSLAKTAEAERLAFGAEVRGATPGIGDPGGFVEPPPKPARKRR
jgi:transcriptional regulator with XRE-family HTH domain